MKALTRILILCALTNLAVPLIAGGVGDTAAGKGSSARGASSSSTVRMAVSILPQRFFVERVSGGTVDALVLVAPGQNPHGYEPTPRQMQELSRATVWITAGTDFDLAMDPKIRAQFPRLTVIDGTRGVVFRRMTEAHGHDEGDAEEHDNDGDHDLDVDRHSWLGKEPAKLMTDHVRDALIAADPAHREMYVANAAVLKGDIDATFAELSGKLAHKKGSTVYVFHPAFGYFLDEFGIRQEAVEMGGKEPTPKALSDLAAKAKRDGARTIFVQEQFPVAAAKHVAKVVGATVLPLNPLDPDWLGNIRRMGEALTAR